MRVRRSLFALPMMMTMLLVLGTSAWAAAPVVHDGTLSATDLGWSATADGRTVPTWKGARLLQQVGAPQLPHLDVTILVPADASLGGIEIVPLKTRTVTAPAALAGGVALTSSEGVEITQSLFPVEGDAFPSAWGAHGGDSFQRGYRLLSFTLFPVRALRDADGEWDRIEILEEYEVRLLPGDGVPRDHAVRERFVPGEREALERRLAPVLANPEALFGYQRADGIVTDEPTGAFDPAKTPSLGGSPVSYLIITNEAMESSFQALADHRTESGLPAVVCTVEWIDANYRNGADIQETIRSFIREAYQRWGVEYVLLGGDTDVIPARYVRSTFYPPGGFTDIPADLYYACLDGNWNEDGDDIFGEPGVSPTNLVDDCDMAAEVLLGRAPVSDPAGAAAFATKVINYDKIPAASTWANRMLAAAEVLFWTEGGDISLDGAMFAENLLDEVVETHTAMETVRMYESYALTDTLGVPIYPDAVEETRQAALDSLDTGRFGIFVQIGHGHFFNISMADANITVSDADALMNDGRPFLLYGLNCASAAFDYSCLMERFLENPSAGSIASIGASRAAFPYTSNDFQYEFFNLLMQYDVARLGDLIDQSRLPWLSLAYSNSFTRWTFFNYTLLGDPAQTIWSDAPSIPDLTLPTLMGGGDQLFAATVQSGGSPVADASVTVHNGSIYATDTTDALGQVLLPVTIADASDLTVVVNGRNLVWTQNTVPVDLGSSYLSLSDMLVTDDGSLGSSGNGNGLPEAGETLALRPSFQDLGGAGAGASVATLMTSESGVSIGDATASVPAVAPGGTETTLEVFLVTLDSTVEDGRFLEFDIDVDDGPNLWSSDWTLEALAPELEPVSLSWYDNFFGNGDDVLDSGERVTVVCELKNFGVGRSDLVSAKLRSDSPNVTLQDTSTTYTDIELLGTSTGSSLLSMTVLDVGQPHSAWILFTDNYGRTFRHDLELSSPATVTDLSANSALGPDIIAVSWTPATGFPLRGYHVYRSDSEGGPYVRANTDIVEAMAYYHDSGLDLLTRYYYKVSAVDSALVESDLSAFITQSTAPPELGDFPLPFATETSGHCAVGDVTGDGNLEVVLGADEIYVWRPDGSELFDGDGDAQTLGPITNLEAKFTPGGLALAELDGQPGLEIVVCDQTTKMLYVIKSDGTNLPGWPQSLHLNWAWATPAVGDIDGDEDLEIVVNNLAGETFAWHHDGTEVMDGDGDAGTNGVLFVRPEGRWAWGISSPALFDLDGDGGCEIIFGTKYGWGADNKLHAVKSDGTEAAGFPYVAGVGNNILNSPSVADLNVDGIYEIVFVGERDTLYVLEQDGSHYPGFPIGFTADNNGYNCPSPAIGDFDADGELEIAVVSTHGISDAYLTVIDTDTGGGSGSVLPGWPQYLPGNSEGSPVAGDLDGDGMPDIVHGIGGADEETPNNLYAFRHDGTLVDGFPITLGGPIRPSAVITDIDDDLDVEVVYGGWDLNMHVWDLPGRTDGTTMAWATFRGNTHRDGVYASISATSVEEEGTPRPKILTMFPNVPNPFNPSTSVKMYVPGAAGVRSDLQVNIYDVQGRLVRSLHDGPATTGWHEFVWNGRDDRGRGQPSGVYLLRAKSDRTSLSAKMMLVK